VRYRKLDANGDYSFGHSQDDFFINVPMAVGQAIGTRLLLHQGEWFLNTSDGMPWETDVLGFQTQLLKDSAIKADINGTPNIIQIISYTSTFDSKGRALTVKFSANTIYGVVTSPLIPVNGPDGGWGVGGWGEHPYGT
jgi:hypothetical protein